MPRWNSFSLFLQEAQQAPDDEYRQRLVDELLLERSAFPWVENNLATFIYTGLGVERVAVNMDTIESDPPFIPMVKLQGTSLWYVQRRFEADDLLDYLFAVDDPMTPLAQEKNILQRIARYWRIDPRNPTRMTTKWK
jgi:hypothetical protein